MSNCTDRSLGLNTLFLDVSKENKIFNVVYSKFELKILSQWQANLF